MPGPPLKCEHIRRRTVSPEFSAYACSSCSPRPSSGLGCPDYLILYSFSRYNRAQFFHSPHQGENSNVDLTDPPSKKYRRARHGGLGVAQSLCTFESGRLTSTILVCFHNAPLKACGPYSTSDSSIAGPPAMRIEAHLAAGCWRGGGALVDAVYAPGAPAPGGGGPAGHRRTLVGNLKSGEVAALDVPIEAWVRERAPGRVTCDVGALVRPHGYP